MTSNESPSSLLLALPDPCLLEVLRCCAADDQRSLFSAARAHGRLHQAAVLALHSITVVVTQHQQMDGVLLYLSKHGQHVDRIIFEGQGNHMMSLRQLPPISQLDSLQVGRLCVQLQPGDGFEGVLGDAAVVAALRQLRLNGCELSFGNDGETEGLAAALSLLPAGLEHLSLKDLGTYDEWGLVDVNFPTGALQLLQQLTYLELAYMRLVGPDQEQPALQPLQALTRLVDLRLNNVNANEDRDDDLGIVKLTASMLSGTHHLTHLELSDVIEVEPGVLAGKTKLQHLQIEQCIVSDAAAGVAQFLSHLQQLQQLTHLTVARTLKDSKLCRLATPPAAAYSALTASSRLQHLSMRSAALTAGAWQHMFPVGRQLPRLRCLDMSFAVGPMGDERFVPAPEYSCLVSCCPSLQELNLLARPFTPQLLAPLQGLTGLHRLDMGGDTVTAEDLQAVCQLTGLKELSVTCLGYSKAELLLQLTELLQLTTLRFFGIVNNAPQTVKLTSKAPGDDPVWRQLLQFILEKGEPEAAVGAAAALAQRQ